MLHRIKRYQHHLPIESPRMYLEPTSCSSSVSSHGLEVTKTLSVVVAYLEDLQTKADHPPSVRIVEGVAREARAQVRVERCGCH